jgi:NAD(P)-dependent dehydrogenase (short-subunit alcohol dehydrogenase family)
MRTVTDLMTLAGRRALVTGGAGYIGGAACQALVELGAAVGVLDKDAGACERRAAELNTGHPGCAVAVDCDLAEEKETRAGLRRAVAELGGMNIFVHCAAFVGTSDLAGWAVPFPQQTVGAWDAAIRVNLTSAFAAVQELRDDLAAGGHGSVILFSSIYGLVGPDLRLYAGTGMNNAAAYNASKGGLLQLTRYLATVLAPSVRVNAISPGGVLRAQPDAFRRRYEARTPLGRMATEEDLKGAVAYLASDLSAYVTGQNLVVDGGWTIW